MHNVRSFLQCNAMQCNAMQKVHRLCYASLHNVRSFVQCNATTDVISLMNMGKSQFWCAMHGQKCICFSSMMHNDRSFLQCNKIGYLFNEHELVVVCNAVQSKKCIAYMLLLSGQRQIVCAMQCKNINVISLMNMGRSQFWCAMRKVHYLPCILSLSNKMS